MRCGQLLVLAVALFLHGEEAEACSCMPPPPCGLIPPEHTIFVGKLLSLETPDDPYWVLHLKVEESLTGKTRVGEEVRVANGPGMCGAQVRPGDSYLIDASLFHGRLTTSRCSETGELDYKRTLIEELRIREAGGRLNDLQVKFVATSGTGTEKPPAISLGGVDVTLTPVGGGEGLHAKTDTEGVLTMPIVPAGKYLLTADLPKGVAIGKTWKGEPAMVEIPVAQNGAACHYQMSVRPSASISGEAVDAAARKRLDKGVNLTLVNTSSRSSAHLVIEKDGSFIFRFVAPGTYYLTYFDGQDWQHPLFYPGVRTETEAEAIVVGEGEQVSGIRVVSAEK